MSVERYTRGPGFDTGDLQDAVPSNPTIESVGPEMVDIDLPTSSFKADLDDFMATYGYVHDTTDPPSPNVFISLFWQDGVIDKDLTAPPGSPSNGDRYIIPTGATGAWAGHETEIAEWDASRTMWLFVIPVKGYVAFVDDEGLHYYFDGTSWVIFTLNPIEHAKLRQLIHLADGIGGPFEEFPSGAFRECLPLGNAFPTSITWYDDATKAKKIVEKTIVRDAQQMPTTITWKVYDTDGVTVLATVSDAISYQGAVETTRTRTIS